VHRVAKSSTSCWPNGPPGFVHPGHATRRWALLHVAHQASLLSSGSLGERELGVRQREERGTTRRQEAWLMIVCECTLFYRGAGRCLTQQHAASGTASCGADLSAAIASCLVAQNNGRLQLMAHCMSSTCSPPRVSACFCSGP